MKNYSLWNELKFKEYKKINENLNVDVLIVGGGITGLSTLYHLKDSNLKTILVEKNICGKGVTSKSTAKITYLQENVYKFIRKLVDDNTAVKYLKSQIYSTQLIKNIIEKENIKCDFKYADSYLFVNSNNNLKKLKEEAEFLQKCEVQINWVNNFIVDGKERNAFKVNNTYVFHPLKYLLFLRKKLKTDIYENSKVENIERESGYFICKINNKKVKAKHVVVATHYPYFLVPFLMPFKSHIETSYLGAFKTDDYKEISAISIDKPTVSFRYHSDGQNNYKLYLYNSFMSCNIKNIKNHFKSLKEKYNFEYLWSNKDIITNDYIPFIGEIDKNLFMASGYNTWGMTNGTLAGKIISDLILKKENEFENIFSPKRSLNFSKMFRFPLDVSCSIKSIIKSTNFNVNNSNIEYKEIDGDKVAIYTDSKGKSHIVYNKCPHMKCGIVFNEIEKTWDCLCHGSRFDIDGKCIEGPSNYDISYNKKD